MSYQPGWGPPPSPPSAPRAAGRRGWRIGRGGWAVVAAIVVLIAGGVTAGAALSSSSKPKTTRLGRGTVPSARTAPPTTGAPATGGGYLASESNADIFLQWNDNAGQVQGTAQVAALSGQAPDERVSTQTVEVTGTVTRSTISLSFDGSPLQFGTVSAHSFTISFPQQDGTLAPVTFTQAPTTAYNTAVGQLNAQANQANTAAEQAQALQEAQQNAYKAAQAVLSDISSMSQADSQAVFDAKSLANDVASEGEDLAATQALEQQVASETTQDGTGPGSYTCGDAETVAGDAQSVAGDSQSVEGSSQSVTSDIKQLKQAIIGIQSDFAAYLAAEANVPGYMPTPAPAASDMNRAVTNANTAIATAVSTANGYIAQANTEVAQAFGYATEAFQAGNCGAPPSAPSPQPAITVASSG
jgi:hypothetical protein